MTIESQLIETLQGRIKDGSTKYRDIELITYHFGFGGHPWPTLEETGQRFGDLTRERVLQIILRKFKRAITSADVPALSDCYELIKTRGYWRYSELADRIVDAGLVPSPRRFGKDIGNEIDSVQSLVRLSPDMTASRYRVELTESHKRRLNEVANRGRSPARMVKRALALLKANEAQVDDRIAEALSISSRTVIRGRKRFCEEGLESALTERPLRVRSASSMSVPKLTL